MLSFSHLKVGVSKLVELAWRYSNSFPLISSLDATLLDHLPTSPLLPLTWVVTVEIQGRDFKKIKNNSKQETENKHLEVKDKLSWPKEHKTKLGSKGYKKELVQAQERWPISLVNSQRRGRVNYVDSIPTLISNQQDEQKGAKTARA